VTAPRNPTTADLEDPATMVRPVLAISPDDGVFDSYAARDPHLLLHKLVYFFLCAGQVCYNPFLPLLLASSGISPSGIGLIFALRPLALLLATPVLGYIADKGYRRIVLVAALVVATLLRGAVSLTSSSTLMCVLVLAGEAASAPVNAVLDAAILGLLERTSATANYGRTRMIGSLGYGAFAPVAGAIRDAAGPHAAVALFVVLTVIAAGLAWWLPFEGERVFHSRPWAASRVKSAVLAHALPVTEPAMGSRSPLAAPGGSSTSDMSVTDALKGASTAKDGGGSAMSLLRPSVAALLCSIVVMGMLSAFIANFQFL
jgi:MFS family permease